MAAAPEVLSRPSNEARIKAALWFAGQGFGVFSVWSAHPDGTCRCVKGARCTVPGKHPIGEHGFKDATQDPKQIRTLLSAPSDPNYGLVCPEGVFAWDVDGEGWQDKLAALEAKHGPLPATMRTQTRNGQHIILRWPEGHPRPMKHMFGWITRWGSGGSHLGYVIGPRSVHPSGFEYVPAGAFELGTLPDAWAEAAMAEARHGAPGTITIGGELDPASVAVGGRHDYLRDRARFFAGSIRDPDALFAAVWALNEKLPVPKDRESVERAIGDALTKYPADPVEVDEETGETRRVYAPVDDIGLLPMSTSEEFPADPAPVAFAGLVGECVHAMADGTDASLVGMLGSLLAFLGATVPARAYFHREQTTSPYIALVGESSVGRKGTAMMRASGLLERTFGVDEVNRVVLDGVNSGEGLISELHLKQTRYASEATAALLFEEEYANMMAAQGRDNSTLDGKMRQAFDGGPLSNRKALESRTVKPPYWLPALIAITPSELRSKLPSGALQSGSGNRWLFLPVVRRDIVPRNVPPELPEDIAGPLRQAHRDAARNPMVLHADDRVGETLTGYSEHLRKVSIGLAADMTRRFAVIAFRLALIHAACERSATVAPAHLERALALTEYARSGMGWVFGQSLGNPLATLLLRHLQAAGELTSTHITRHVIRDPLKRQDAIDELVRMGFAEVAVSTPGRPGGRPRATLVAVSSTTGGLFPRFHVKPHDGTGSRGTLEQTPVSRSDGLEETLEKTPRTVEETLEQTGEWLRPCRDYSNHQARHRQTPKGWVCGACDEEETR